ncbi:hypothetical protein NM208_g8432 [Fusarium decemcellulare]|uniref:Uncharacterized protein n=1 Tax=Fusarium decemcellulare TaxID=57161 RepID=A0ACC1S5I4_9HYPO|nr:hypothetical protein NM208_g8432 [Fusarium decemcellulare]
MSNPNDYTVGWICAIVTEYVAAQAFLDEQHEGPEFVSVNDNNDYTLGKVGKHNVVIAVLPHGEYGLSSAASVARDMLHSFPNVRVGLMVGIGGGAPSSKHDIHLGDVVVSASSKGTGVLQYDFGKTIQGQVFQETGFLNQPPSILRAAVNGLMAQYEREGHRLDENINEVLEKKPRLQKKYKRPEPNTDRLYRPGVLHPVNNNDSGCAITCGDDPSVLVVRPQRTKDRDNPTIHYGRIASANRLMKDALVRDEFATKKDVLCFEMEAAGLMNHFACLVIRGICDYSDSHKNKEWQGYAAMAASAYAKDLLCRVAPNRVEAMNKISEAISDLKNEVSNTSRKADRILHHQRTQEQNEMLDWLTPVDYGSQQSDYIERRQPGTGNWLLRSTEFRTWLENSNQTLFCPGIPGAGKTILTSVVIEDMTSRFCWNTDIGIAYVYCNFRRQDQQNVVDLLASLLKQLAQGRPSLPVAMKSLYTKHKKDRTRPSLEEISSTLRTVCEMYQRVFIVVDALDECRESDLCRDRFLSELFSLQPHCGVNLFATSRPLANISVRFTGSLSLPIFATQEDVERYLEGHLGNLRSWVKRNQQLQDTIKKGISEAVEGMFILAQIYLQSLKDKVTENEVRRALQAIHHRKQASGGDRDKLLSSAYHEAMERINRQERGLRKLAMRVLSWITCAKRQLTTKELQDALATKRGKPSLDTRDVIRIEDMVSVCAGLVTVDKESRVIRLAHYTTQQYFNDRRHRLFPNAEAHITATCVTYLSFSVFEKGPCQSGRQFRERLQSHRFYDYGARNWGHHARTTCLQNDQLLVDFLESDNKASAARQAMMASGYETHYNQISPSTVSGLHLAADFGLGESVSTLLNRGHNPNAMDTYGRTPLSWAAQRGHDMVVQQLLAAEGINLDLKCQCMILSGGMARVGSSDMGEHLFACLLLDDLAVNRCGATPLWYAALNGHDSTVKLLLAEKRVNSSSRDDHFGTTPLWCASGNGHETTFKLLEEYGAGLEDRDSRDAWTPLSIAAWRGHEVIVKLLLAKNHVDPDSTDSGGLTPLQRATEKGHRTVVGLLLADNRVNPNSKDKYGGTALCIAAGGGHETIVEMLLGTDGVDVNATDSFFGRSPLHSAVANGKDGVVRLLLTDKRIDVNWRDSEYGRTPLSFAADRGSTALIELLLATGQVDLNSQDRQGRTPLILAVRASQAGVVKQLLANNAVNLDHKDKFGQTALMFAARRGFEEVVKLLLDKEADIELSDGEGRTPLMWAAQCGKESVVKLLLDKGASITSNDVKSHAPLSLAIEKGHETKTRSLSNTGYCHHRLQKAFKKLARRPNMANLDVVRSVNNGRVGAVFEIDDDNNLESRVTDARQRDIESTLPPWICVLGAFLFAIPSFGFMQSVGTLQSYLKLNQLSEYSTGDIGWITGMYMFLSYFFNIQVGPICDHYGPMVVGPIGVIMTVASFLVLAECNTYWQLMLCLGIFGSLGGAVIATVAMSAIGKLFTRRQGLAMGVALTGSSVGAILFPMLLRSTLARLGWRWAIRILAFTIAGIIIPGLLCFVPFEKLARSLPNHATSRSGGPAGVVINFAAFRSTPFSFVTGGSFLLEFAIFGIAGLLPTIATNTGFSPEDGYTLLSILGVGSCIGRILPGLFGDLVGPFNVILIMTATTLLFMATLFIPFANKSESVLYAFSALWGFGSGSFLSVTPVCVGKTCEARDYGRFYGTWTFFVSFSVLLAIPLSGLLLDNMGTQALAGLLTAVVFLGGVCYVAARALMVGKLLSPKIKM